MNIFFLFINTDDDENFLKFLSASGIKFLLANVTIHIVCMLYDTLWRIRDQFCIYFIHWTQGY